MRRLKTYGHEVTMRLVFKLFVKERRRRKAEEEIIKSEPMDQKFYKFSRHQSLFTYDESDEPFKERNGVSSHSADKNYARNHANEINKIVLGQAVRSSQTTGHSHHYNATYFSLVNT
jgi:hypothetical protein